MTFSKQLLHLLYPSKCPLCGEVTDGQTPRLCMNCAQLVQPEWHLCCPICQREAPQCRCGTTLLPTVGAIGHIAPGFYRPGNPDAMLSRLIFTLKHDPDETTAHVLASEMSRVLIQHFLPSGEVLRHWVFTYAPRTRRARWSEGVDQARRLAILCAQRCGGTFADVLIRHGGQEQKTLGEQERRANALHSLHVRRKADIQGKKFILVDDILTTGATLSAGVELLRDAGAKSVFCLTTLKTMPHRKKNKTTPDNGPLWFQTE